jgi:hypothetical protein
LLKLRFVGLNAIEFCGIAIDSFGNVNLSLALDLKEIYETIVTNNNNAVNINKLV